VSIALEDGPAYYYPVRHAGDNLPEEQVFAYLRDEASRYEGIICGANLQYDLDYLAQVGIDFPNVSFFRDCQIADPLICELHDTYSLDAIAQRWGMPGKDEQVLKEAASSWGIDPKVDMWKLPARYVGEYAIQDAILPLKLLRRQEREIEEQDIWDVYDLESRVLPILLKMRRRGVRVDRNRLQTIEDWSEQEEKAVLQQVRDLSGVEIPVGGVWKADIVARALEAVGISVNRTAKTKQPMVDKHLLGNATHPIGQLIERARKVNKLRTTFAASVREHLIGDRIHCSFHQLRMTRDDGTGKGARFGRLSCTDPNLQQQPSRDDFAKMWRSIYVPDDDGMFASCDYSQQEPRMLVHFAETSGCPGALRAGDTYRRDPDADNHTMMARMIYRYAEDQEPSKTHRTNAKIIFLGLCYAMGGAKLATGLGLPTKPMKLKDGRTIEVAGDEAQKILDQFHREVPFVRSLAKLCEDRAKSRGFIRTLSGRKCRFPEGENGFDWCHKALNRLIQGSAADQTKMAMVALDAAGHKIQLQIHDEINLTVQERKQAEEVGEIMRTCVKLSVPSKVDVEVGPNWGDQT
jgi:DNA polymerase I-like protein with 3'-5' exonuclease and polymerase domains